MEREYNENFRTNNGHVLLAQIFAFWTILNSCETVEGMEYLYNPHPAQLITVFILLGIASNKLSSRLAEVLTGEGKSIVLAALSCYLSLIGFKVHCICYSKLLSKRDAADFQLLFTALGLGKSIVYGTYATVIERNYLSVHN